MQRKTISGTIQPPEEKKQRQLHRQLREYAEWMHQMKDRKTNGNPFQSLNFQCFSDNLFYAEIKGE